jgi:alanine dehydrogenase
MPFAVKLANLGVVEAIKHDPHLKNGVNTYKGKCVYEAVALDQGLDYTPIDSLI